MGKHTPGPWVDNWVDLVGSNGQRVLIADSRIAFATAFEHPERVANAQLMKAAPDLLDELIEARNTIYSLQSAMAGPFFQEQIDRIDAAIKKATQ